MYQSNATPTTTYTTILPPFFNLFIESRLKCNLKYFILKSIYVLKKALKIAEISVELIRNEEIFCHAVFVFDVLQYTPSIT